MGSSGEDPNKGIDATVGSLVWVRRRNGSWWPGKILSPDELPEGSLPTLRSGTPVKLLGRDDASVDWYNLEKSKRVKAFHCGEYDDCIEKVKASSSKNNLSKKAVNYARREDAILHALKLENAHLGKDSSPTPPEDDTLSIDESEEREDNDEDYNTSEDESDLAPENPAKEEETNNPNNNNNNSEEEEDEEGILKRTRGLEDINTASSLKRKRSHFQEILKKKSRRRTLTKVLKCTTMMSENKDSVLESYEQNKDSSNLIGNDSDSNGVFLHDSMKCKQEDNETSGGPEVLESSRRLFDVRLVAEEKVSAGLSAIVPDKPQHIHTGGGAHNEPGSTSQWQSKGKRNSRTRKVNIDNEAEKYTIDPVTETEVKGFRGWSWNIPQKDSRVPHRSLPYRQSRFTVNPKYDSSDFSLAHHNNNTDNSNNISSSDLFDVAVEVEMGYRPQRVPYISLMSKINGRPIVGHHLAVDVLDNGSCDDLIDFYSSGSEMDRRGRSRGRPPKPGRPSRSTNKNSKKNGQLSKKTKKLSALTGAHRLSREEKKKKKTIVEKVNKGPSIACVPLNVVFSRLNGCLNGSTRPAPRPVSTQQ